MNPRHTARYGYSLGRPIQPPHGWRTLAEGEPVPGIIRVYMKGLGWSDETFYPYLAHMTDTVLSIAVPIPVDKPAAT